MLINEILSQKITEEIFKLDSVSETGFYFTKSCVIPLDEMVDLALTADNCKQLVSHLTTKKKVRIAWNELGDLESFYGMVKYGK